MKRNASTGKGFRAVIMTFKQLVRIPCIFVYYKIESSPGSLDSSQVDEREPYSAENACSKG